ncbi:hypothetical protein ACFFX0_07470 [Citricoccus parietis]|uniref:Uncharacterized protein n=1 Tax=Citricoccus parietis TaxID=592307 RepID=A0ABV5FXS9_9MICC
MELVTLTAFMVPLAIAAPRHWSACPRSWTAVRASRSRSCDWGAPGPSSPGSWPPPASAGWRCGIRRR